MMLVLITSPSAYAARGPEWTKKKGSNQAEADDMLSTAGDEYVFASLFNLGRRTATS